jgi:hypothetical protein
VFFRFLGLPLQSVAFRAVGILIGVSWSLLKMVAVPVLAVEGTGPLSTLRRSASILRGRWGEGITGRVWIVGLAVLIGVVPGVAAAGVGIGLIAVGAGVLGAALLAIGVAYALAAFTGAAALSQVFGVALYRYATRGETSGPFGRSVLQDAVGRKRPLRAWARSILGRGEAPDAPAERP